MVSDGKQENFCSAEGVEQQIVRQHELANLGVAIDRDELALQRVDRVAGIDAAQRAIHQGAAHRRETFEVGNHRLKQLIEQRVVGRRSVRVNQELLDLLKVAREVCGELDRERR